MPTKTVTITHEPWWPSTTTHSATDIVSCGTEPIDLSASLSVWAYQYDDADAPVVMLDNSIGIKLSAAQGGQPRRVHP